MHINLIMLPGGSPLNLLSRFCQFFNVLDLVHPKSIGVLEKILITSHVHFS